MIPMCEALLNNDVRNNSAWSFRYFIVMRKADQLGKKDPSKGFCKDLVEQEINYTMFKRLP